MNRVRVFASRRIVRFSPFFAPVSRDPGPKAETPVDDIEPPAKVRTVIKLVEPEVIRAVYRKVLEFEFGIPRA